VALEHVPPEPAEAPAEDDGRVRVAIVGRPNVGKSTLVNTLLGEERVIAFDQPGTTRDSIALDFERGGKRYTLVDTAGVRRRGKVFEAIEKFSIIKTMQAIEDANVVVLLLDAEDGITEQDAHLAGHILEAGRALVVAINKWDAASTEQREEVKREIGRKLAFLDFATQLPISAREGRGLPALLAAIDAAYAAAMVKLPTPRLTRALQLAVERQQPPRAGMNRPKLRYAHQGGSNPPIVVIHGTSLSKVPDAYRRYLEHFFADAFKLRGTPLRIQFKTGVNPYADARTSLTGRAAESRGRPLAGQPTASGATIAESTDEQQRAVATRPVPEHAAQGTRTGLHLPRQRHQAPGPDRVVRSVRRAAEEHRDANGLQARDLHRGAVAAGHDAAPEPRRRAGKLTVTPRRSGPAERIGDAAPGRPEC
jgi:small GTP-binding protein